MSKPTPAIYKTTNWPAYNDALKRRGSLTIWFDPKMCWHAAPTGKRGRQPTYSDAAIQACMTKHHYTRRSAIFQGAFAGAAAVVPASIAVATPSPANQPQNTPILCLFRQWAAEREAAHHVTEEECEAAVDRMGVLEMRILALPSTCPADLAAKVASYTSYGDFELPARSDEEGRLLWDEIEDLLSAGAGAAMAPAPVDPHRAWLNEWHANQDAFDAEPDCEAGLSPYLERANEIEKLICTTPARTRDGLVAQMEWANHESGLSAYMNNFADNLDGTFLHTVLEGLRHA